MNRHWCGASSCVHLGSCPVYPEISILLVVPGNIFYERSKVDDNGKRVYPDASECAKHAGILASRMEEGTIRPTACPGLANDIVSVVTGLLYDERDHFHLQVQASCIVPTRNEVSAFAEATTHWKATAPFNGIPFRANLTPKEIQLRWQPQPQYQQRAGGEHRVRVHHLARNGCKKHRTQKAFLIREMIFGSGPAALVL